MELQEDEKIIAQTKSKIRTGVVFPFKKGSSFGTSYTGIKLYLTNKRIVGESSAFSKSWKQLNINRDDIITVKIKKKKILWFNTYSIRVKYEEKGKKKEVLLSFSKEDFENWAYELR